VLKAKQIVTLDGVLFRKVEVSNFKVPKEQYPK